MSINRKELTKLISYMVMGDGGVYYGAKSANGRFIMNMKEENSDYIEWCHSVLSQITTAKIMVRPDYNTDGFTRKAQLKLETASHPFFTVLHTRIYTDKYKGLDPHALKMLDAEALAILYMCDGSLYIDKAEGSKKGLINDSYTVRLHMKRLSYGDQYLLKKFLKDKLDLEWNVNKAGKYYELRLRSKDVARFMELVSPHVLPSFKYKLVRLTPEMDGDIVCSSQECEEVEAQSPTPATCR